MGSTRAHDDDAGLIVLGWLTKLVVTMAVLGLIGFDGVSLVAAKFSIADRAGTYANDAAEMFKQNKDIDKTYATIVTEAAAKGDTVDIKAFSVAPDGQVTLKVSHVASTLWMDKVSFLKEYTTVTETGNGTPP